MLARMSLSLIVCNAPAWFINRGGAQQAQCIFCVAVPPRRTMASVRNQSTIAQGRRALPSTVDTLVHGVVHDYLALQAQLRWWRWGLVLMIGLQLVVGRMLGMPWGLALLLFSAASFIVHEAVLLLVVGMVLLVSALVNSTSLQLGGLLVALVQMGCAVLALRCYTRCRTVEERYGQLARGLDIGLPPPLTYGGAALPWLGVGVSLLALALSVGTSASLVGDGQYTWTTYLPLDLAVGGLALCIAALAHRRLSALAMLGVVIAALVVLGWIVVAWMR